MGKVATRAALAAAACGLAAAAVVAGGPHGEPWVEGRVREIRGSDTTGWQRIPWAGSLADACKAAAKEKGFVFLFSHDGNLETGRC